MNSEIISHKFEVYKSHFFSYLGSLQHSKLYCQKPLIRILPHGEIGKQTLQKSHLVLKLLRKRKNGPTGFRLQVLDVSIGIS